MLVIGDSEDRGCNVTKKFLMRAGAEIILCAHGSVLPGTFLAVLETLVERFASTDAHGDAPRVMVRNSTGHHDTCYASLY